MRDLIEYDFDIQMYSQGVSVDTNCIDLLIINQGLNTAYVKNVPLSQGQQFPVTGNAGEILRNTVNITFSNTGTDNRVIVIRRYYL